MVWLDAAHKKGVAPGTEGTKLCVMEVIIMVLILPVFNAVILPLILLHYLSYPPLHLLHQLQQGLLELAADGLSLVFPGDSAALSHVTSSMLTCDLCVSQEEV